MASLWLRLFVFLSIVWQDGRTAADTDRVRQWVSDAVRRVQDVLDSERHPQFAADVPHTYEDKFLLAELSTRVAIGSLSQVLDALVPAWRTHEEVLLQRVQAGSSVSLRFASCQRCSSMGAVSRDVESQRVETIDWLRDEKCVKLREIHTVEEHLWAIEADWELSAVVGTDVAGRMALLSGLSKGTVTSRTSQAPWRKEECLTPLELDITWLLRQWARGRGIDFAINRSHPSCRTPRRNEDVQKALEFFSDIRDFSWNARYHLYNLQHRVVQYWVTADVLYTQEPELPPVMAAFTLEKHNATAVLSFAGDVQTLLSRYRHSLERQIKMLLDDSPKKAHERGLLSTEGMRLILALYHARVLFWQYEQVMSRLEQMLREQLVRAIGRELADQDLMEYMEFHYTRLLRPEFQPKAFSYAVRQPQQYPDGIVSLEMKGTGVPIRSVVKREWAEQPMRFSLSTVSEVSFLGERVVHACLLHHFAADSLKQGMYLMARARRFGGFIVLIGKIQGADGFEPTSAVIVKDKDEWKLPLLAEMHPTAKEFKAAVASLSPTQLEFATAWRDRQLSGSLFAICIIQIRPQLERLLKLPPGALTKELQLVQDITELLLKYQISSDLFTYEGDQAANRTEKVEVVRHHVDAVLETIEAAKRLEIAKKEEEARKAEAARRAREEERRKEEERARASWWTSSSLSLRSYARLGCSLSVLDFLHLGSSLSLRSYARLGSSISVLDFLHLGSSLPLRNFGRLSSSIQTLDFFEMGSSLQLRSYGRLGSSPQTLDFLHLGSSLSLRNFVPLSGSLSVIDIATFGSSLSVRSFLRIGSTLSGYGMFRLGEAEGLILEDSIRMLDTEEIPSPGAKKKKRKLLRRLPRPPVSEPPAETVSKPRENPDYTLLPKKLDEESQRFGVDAVLRPTTIRPVDNDDGLLFHVTEKTEYPGLLSPPKAGSVSIGERRKERDRAFDLLDALSRSGTLVFEDASLHVVMASTHNFEQTLIDTVVRGNINPIEQVERSAIVQASIIHAKSPEELISPAHEGHVRATSPMLFTTGNS